MFKFGIFLVLLSTSLKFNLAAIIDCQRTQQLVDPAKCCLDGGRDEATEICLRRMGIDGQPSDVPPTVEVATCLAECILTESKYMQKPETLELRVIKDDLYTKYPNDTIYADVLLEAFRECQPTAQRKMKVFKHLPLGKSCNPFAGIVLGCTYMEYFKNCPAHRWTENAECKLAKQFVKKCSLGA